MQSVLEMLQRLPDREAHEVLLRRIDQLEQHSVDGRLEPVIDHEAVAAALDERLGKARDHAERRIEGRIASIERQLANICEQISQRGTQHAKGEAGDHAQSSEPFEAIAAMLKGGRLAGIEKKVDRLNHAVQSFVPSNVNEQIDSIRAELTDLRQTLAAGENAEAVQQLTSQLEQMPSIDPLKQAVAALTERAELNERVSRAGMERLITEVRELKQGDAADSVLAGAIERLTARLSALESAQADQAGRVAEAAERIEQVAGAMQSESSGVAMEGRASHDAAADATATAEAITSLNGRLDGIERAIASRDPLLAQIGEELRHLHSRLDAANKSDARDRVKPESQAKESRLSVSASGSFASEAIPNRAEEYSESEELDESWRGRDPRTPAALDGYIGVQGPSRWRSAALLALTLMIIIVPMVLLWREIDRQMNQQNRMVEELQPANDPITGGVSGLDNAASEVEASAALVSLEP